jgi:DNA-binding PadR family transcriptional regulator
MKGAFLVDRLGPESWQELFSFRPYRFGPFDSSVYAIRDQLVRDGLLERHGNGRYATYSITEAGKQKAAETAAADERFADWLRGIGRWVTGKSFSDLLRDIYERYPEFATHSVMR